MTDTKMSNWTWPYLNSLGRAVTLIGVAYALMGLLGIILDDKVLRALWSPGPSIMLLGICSAVVVIEIPIVILAWRKMSQTGKGHFWHRALIVMFLAFAIGTVVDGVVHRARIEQWYPQTFPVVFSVLYLAIFGLGHKPVATPPPEALESKSPSKSGA